MTPFEKASINTQGMYVNMVASLIITAKIKQVMAEEECLAQMGGGAPGYFDAVNIGMKWADVAGDPIGDC
jgi:hypothetical protein